MTTTFKIYFAKENIRKVTLGAEYLDYDSFVEFLKGKYEMFLPKEFLIQYFDQDGDLITVSSHIEWEEMFCQHEGVISVYLKEEAEKETVSAGEMFAELFRSQMFRPHVFRSQMFRPQQCFSFQNKASCSGRFSAAMKMRKFYYCFQTALSLMEREDETSLLYAKEYFQKCLEFVPENSSVLYNIACVESLLGNIDESVFMLKGAIHAGWNDLVHMVEDSDFDNIRNTTGFEECIGYLTHEDEEIIESTFEYSPLDQSPKDTPTSVEIEVSSPSEDSNKLTEISDTLTELGIYMDPTTLSTLSAKFSNDLNQIVNYYYQVILN